MFKYWGNSMKLNRKKILLIILIILVTFIATFFLREYISNYFVRITMDTIQLPMEDSRVLVFAPHSDDEIIGAGDLIKKSLKNGAQVKVVIVTNGDGFKRAVAIECLRVNPNPADYIRYGNIRQIESINALERLGLNREHVVFLGYPDRGISRLWLANWSSDKPYISNYTKLDKSPYELTYNIDSVYSGECLNSDITKVIDDFKPTHIIFPHTNDTHPDHWAINAFIKYSITVSKYQPKHEWTYLVHRGGWPTPLARNRNMFLVPPLSILNTGTTWFSMGMSDEDIEDKADAMSKYTSQIKRISRLMSAFERKNELFGEYENGRLIRNKRNDNEIEPDADNLVIQDPKRDTINLEINKGSDIVGIFAEVSKQNNLHLFIKLNSKCDRNTDYLVNLMFINDETTIKYNLPVKRNKLNLGVQAVQTLSGEDIIKLKIKNNIMHFIINEQDIGYYTHLFINAGSSLKSIFMDRTAWRMLEAD